MSIYNKVFGKIHDYYDRTAIKFFERSISYLQLNNAINYFSQRLKNSGIVYGEKVLLFLPNYPEFIISFFSITNIGGVAVLVDVKLNEEVYKVCIENNIKIIITDYIGRTKFNKLDEGLEKSKYSSLSNLEFLCIEDLKLLSHDSDNTYNIYKQGNKYHVNEEDAAIILYTSGSTESPKGVINTHKTLQAALENYLATLPLSSTDKLIAVAPFFHSYSMGSCMLSGLAVGGTLLLQHSFQPRKILRLIDEEKATVFQGVPFMYSLMIQQFDTTTYSLNTLRFCISAGAPIQEKVMRNFYELTGKVIHQEYGSTETGTIALNLSTDLEKNINSVGKALRNVEVRIKKEKTAEYGIIQVKSQGKSIGYLGGPMFDLEWYSTGDIGEIREDGYIYILGRAKKLINVAGVKVNPNEVENILRKHPQVKDVLVSGAAHPDFGEVVSAIIVRKCNFVYEEELILFCQKHLALHKVPKIIKFVEELEKSSTGKTIHIQKEK